MNQRPHFHHRIPATAIATDEPLGYSLWHLLAMGLLAQAEVAKLLESCQQIDSDVLLDDLREKMAVLNAREKWRLRTSQLSDRHVQIRWKCLREQTAWKTPMEICVEIDRPLLAGYWWRETDLHPVVKAFQWESCEKLGLPLRK